MKNYRSGEEKFNILMGVINTNITVVEYHRKYTIEPLVYYRLGDQLFGGMVITELNNTLIRPYGLEKLLNTNQFLNSYKRKRLLGNAV